MKQIAGYEDYYISESGDVWSMKTGELKRRKPQFNAKGYKMIMLSRGNKRKYWLVSRLVLLNFKPRVPGKDYCNHINGNKQDNRIANLEWCTIAENNRHAIEVLGNAPLINKRGRDNHRAMRYTLTDPSGVHVYETLKEAVRLSGYSEYKIYNSVKYGTKLHVNYVWEKERIKPVNKESC